MSISSEEGHMGVPMSSSTSSRGNGDKHTIHHHEPTSHSDVIPTSSTPPKLPLNPDLEEEDAHHHHHQWRPYMNMSVRVQVIRYRECLKNHAAAIGGNATDGCGEFTPAGQEGTLEALRCSACDCHRNFHRKEISGEEGGGDRCSAECYGSQHYKINATGHHNRMGLGVSEQRQVLCNRMGAHPEEIGTVKRLSSTEMVVRKRRFRTKFTQEQKEKMLEFAEKADWKLQKVEDSAVQQFCVEIGIKRRVLKVWMHNNKHNNFRSNSTC